MKVVVSLVLFCFITAFSSIAQTSQGPFSVGTFSNVPRAGSVTSWTNLSNASSSDNSHVSIPAGSLSANGDYTDYFVATNFGFSIPAGATVLGIVVEIERSDTDGGKDGIISIVKGGVIGTEDKSLNPAWSSEAYISYGDVNDLWSDAWTNTDINSTSFGIAISVRKQGGGPSRPQPLIDHVRITVHYLEASLPIELVDFQANLMNGDVYLEWETASELNNDYFTVERSTDLKRWEQVLRVQGAGNSNGSLLYKAIDNSPLKGISYYRLKQTDYDGRFEIFSPKSVSNTSLTSSEAKIYPNPFVDFFTIKGVDSSVQNLIIHDSKGMIVKRESTLNTTLGFDELTIDTRQFSSGIYWVMLNGKSYKIVKF